MKRFIRTLAAAAAASLPLLASTASAGAANAAPAVRAAALQAEFHYLALPDKRFVPVSVVRATDGSLWIDAQARVKCGTDEICILQAFGRWSGGKIAMTTFPGSNGRIGITAFPLNGAYQSLSAGPNGTAWIVSGSDLFVFDTSGTLSATYALAPPTGQLTAPQLGADGRMWLTDFASDVYAVAADGTVSTYACSGSCGALIAGRDHDLWGIGLTSDYQQFLYSVSTGGTVTEYPGISGTLVAGPGSRLATYGATEIESIGPQEQLAPLADLQPLDWDQTLYVSASQSTLWVAGSRNNEAQAEVATVSERGGIRSTPLRHVPCSESYVYFSPLVLGSDGAMYGGFGCGDITGTHAGYLLRVTPE
jgi:hypothetical protein